MDSKISRPNRAMIYLALISFLCVVVVTILLYREMQQVRQLQLNQRVLIDQLATKTLDHRKLMHRCDSLVKMSREQKNMAAD